LFIAELALVFIVSAFVNKLSPTVAGSLFLLYSALTGVTFPLLLLVYTGAPIAATFAVAAGMFGAIAIYGTSTKRNLSGIGRFCAMTLVSTPLRTAPPITCEGTRQTFCAQHVAGWPREADRVKCLSIIESHEQQDTACG
jgi:hypothetical protein